MTRPEERRFLAGFAVLSGLLGVFFYLSFFSNFNSTLSDWSGSGFTWTHQMFFNFFHGRPFQSSLFATQWAGASVGFKHNPFAFIHANVIHVNITPYLFAFVWALNPTPAWIYGVFFLWNLLAGALFACLILRRLSPGDHVPKAVFALSVLMGGGLMGVLEQMAQFLLFAGPVFLAAYYCMLAKRRALFLATVVFACLLSEDVAVVMGTFAAYIFFFEKDRRWYAWTCGLFSAAYFLALQLWVQPAARSMLVLTESTNFVGVLKHVLHLTPSALVANVRSMLPVITLLPAFVAGLLLFGRPSREEARRIAALILLPALPHWGESLVVGGAHHLEPPFFFAFLGLLRMVGTSHEPPKLARRRAFLLASAGAFLLSSARVLAGDLPNRFKPWLYRMAGKAEKAHILERRLEGEEASNRAVIESARSLDLGASLVYLTNKTVAGFIVGRSEIWQFPDFFDLADYLLIQKDAKDLTFVFDPSAGGLRESLRRGRMSDSREAPMTPAMARAIVDALVRKERSYRIVREDDHVLLLERIERREFLSPPATIGFGWVANLPGG